MHMCVWHACTNSQLSTSTYLLETEKRVNIAAFTKIYFDKSHNLDAANKE